MITHFDTPPEAGNIYHCDALTLLKALPDASVDLIAADPPYNGVKDEAWDNQWRDDTAFIEWLSVHLREMRRVLKPNGSLYLFASPRMAARTEIAVGEQFNVLNRITWRKDAGWHKKAEFEALRGYFPATEAIVFAEQYGADKPYGDALIDGNSTYWQALESAKVSVIGDYLKSEFQRAGVTNREIAALFPSRTGGLTGCVSNWLLGLNVPTPEQYQKMRDYLNARGGEYLRREYEYLRREYEDLRREYEDLRRPFFATPDAPYTDVWDFKTVNTYPGKHVCEKPLEMMRHIVRISSRPGDLVCDPFVGSGQTTRAAFVEGRQYIGCDADGRWANRARHYTALPVQISLFAAIGG